MSKSKKSKVIDEETIPRAKFLNILSVSNSEQSLVLALSSALFKSKVQQEYGFLTKEQESKLYLQLAEKNFCFPDKDEEFHQLDKIVSQGDADPKLLDRKQEKIEKILKKFR